MATATVRRRAKEHPGTVTAVLTIVGYGLVVGTFVWDLPIYPDIGIETVNLLADLIAVVNTLATTLLALGWYWIRRGEVEKHRTAMVAAFILIILFLLLYLPKVGGGGTKEFVGPPSAFYAYIVMLAIHIVLSILAVPVVLYALVLGLTHRPEELSNTNHARVGRVAAASWIVSLALGVLAYVLLNHVYDWEFSAAVLVPMVF